MNRIDAVQVNDTTYDAMNLPAGRQETEAG